MITKRTKGNANKIKSAKNHPLKKEKTNPETLIANNKKMFPILKPIALCIASHC